MIYRVCTTNHQKNKLPISNPLVIIPDPALSIRTGLTKILTHSMSRSEKLKNKFDLRVKPAPSLFFRGTIK